MKLAIVDDNLTEARLLQSLIEDVFSDMFFTSIECTMFSDTNSFLAKWKPNLFDVLVLDIYIDQKNGIDLARIVRSSDSNIHIVFCSSSNEFATESYEVNAIYYLTKPVTENKISQMLSRIDLKQLNRLYSLHLPDGTDILLNQIVYTDYFNHVVSIHFKDHTAHQLRISHTEMAELLAEYPHFHSPTRGILINFYEVSSLENGIIIMSDGTQIPISRRKKKETEDTFMNFRFQKLIKELKE